MLILGEAVDIDAAPDVIITPHMSGKGQKQRWQIALGWAMIKGLVFL